MTTTDLNIDLLRKLCDVPGIPGREEAVREFVREEMVPLVDEISVDALGNLIGVRRGRGGPRTQHSSLSLDRASVPSNRFGTN